MGIDHDVVLGCLLHGIEVVVVHRLAVVEVATWNYITHISAFHGIVAVVVHELISFLHVSLIIGNTRTSLVMHHQFHALAVSIIIQVFNVKVGIRSYEVEYIGLPHARPVFPTNVPSLNKYLVKTIGSGKVDVALHLLGVSAMATVRFSLRIVGLAKFHTWELIGVVPCAVAYNHFPPHTAVLGWVNPASVLNLARLVEVKDKARGEHVASIIAHHHGAPGSLARSLHAALVASGIGGEP